MGPHDYEIDRDHATVNYNVTCPVCGDHTFKGHEYIKTVLANDHSITVTCPECERNIVFTVMLDNEGHEYVPGALYVDIDGCIYRVGNDGYECTLVWDPIPNRKDPIHTNTVTHNMKRVDALYVGLLYNSIVELAQTIMETPS